MPALIAASCVLVMFTGEKGRMLLRYERNEVLAGALWRLVTAHLAHLNLVHGILNIIALMLLAGILSNVLTNRDWLIVSFVAAVSICGSLLLLDQATSWYVGLSGVLHGIFAAGAIKIIELRQRIGWIMLVVLAAKIAWEQLSGPVASTQWFDVGPVVINAHLYGSLSGVGVMLVKMYRSRRAASI